MTSRNTSMGGLYVTVNLDIKGAMAQLDVLETKFRSTMQNAVLSAGAIRGLNAVARSLTQTGQAATVAASGIGKTANAMRGLRQEVSRGGFAQVSTKAFRDIANEAKRLGDFSKSTAQRVSEAQKSISSSLIVTPWGTYGKAVQNTLRGIANSAAAAGQSVAISQKAQHQALQRVIPLYNEAGQRIGATTVGLQRFAQGVRGATSALNQSAPAVKQASANWTSFGKQLGQTAAVLAPGRAGTLLYGLTSMGSAMGALGGGISAGAVAGIAGVTIGIVAMTAAIYKAVEALTKLITFGVNTAATYERLAVSMETLLGSEAAARSEINALLGIALESPFLTDTIIQMDKMLLASGVLEGNIRGKLIPAVLNMAAAFGLTDDSINSITYALSQVTIRGFLTGDELRQLANQFIQTWEALSLLPRFEGMSQAEIRKATELGTVSAREFNDALILLGERYAGAAEAQAQTFIGTILKIKDQLQQALGLSFMDFGPLNALTNFLKSILFYLQSLDFAPFAHSVGNFFRALLGPLGDFARGSQGLVVFFEQTLPNAINFTAAVIRTVWDIFMVFADVIGQVFHAISVVVRDAFTAMGDVFAAFEPVVKGFAILIGAAFLAGFVGAISGVMIFVSALGILVNAIALVANIIHTFILLLGGDVVAAATQFNQAVGNVQSIIGGFGNALKGPLVAIDAVAAGLQAINDFKVPKMPFFFGRGGGSGFQTPEGTGPAEGLPTEEDMGKANKTAQELAKLMDELFDLTRRWFGLRSELEKAFLGETGFTASLDSIVNMGIKLIEIFRQLNAPQMVRLIEQGTLALMALARQRDVIADLLEQANDRLADAIQARDDFANDVRRSAIAFANSFDLAEETVSRFRTFMVGGVGIVAEDERTQTESFAEAMKKRLKILKDFLRNVKTLAARGLDKGLLEQIVSAGPEQGGAIAEGLVAGGQEMVGQVNVLQNQIGSVASALGKFGADAFYQAGVDQAQAEVDGLTSKLAEITAAAEAITKVIFDAIAPWAKEMSDAAAAGAAGAAGELAAGAASVGTSMDKINTTIQVHADRWDKMMSGAAITARTSVDTEFDTLLEAIRTWVTDSTEAIDGWILDIKSKFDEFKINISGANINFYAIGAALFGQLADIMGSALGMLGGTVLSMIFPFIPSWGYTVGLLRQQEEKYRRLAAGSAGPSGSGSSGSGRGAGGRGEQESVDQTMNQAAAGSLGQAAAPTVQVFIGETELTDIVDTQVLVNQSGQVQQVVRGRRP